MRLRFGSMACGVLALVAAHVEGATDRSTLRAALGTVGVPFVPNEGQWGDDSAFGANTFAGAVRITRDGRIRYRLGGRDAQDVRGLALTESFVSPNGRIIKAMPNGYRPAVSRVSYQIGSDPSRHRLDMPTYERISLGDVYDGINVQLRATGDNIEKIFTVAPRASPARIRVMLEGAESIAVAADGRLVAHTARGDVAYTAPVAWQEAEDGSRTSIEVAYAIAGRRSYGFRVGAHDAQRPLFIDPLIQSTYFGGSGVEFGLGITINPNNGEVLVVGQSSGTDLPTTAGGTQPANAGSGDAFVARFNPTLTGAVLQATYFGGTLNESASLIAVHPASGEILIGGVTNSGDLPGTTGATQAASAGAPEVFVARFNPTLTGGVLKATYYGGTDTDTISALLVLPSSGDILIAGTTNSTTLPGVDGASSQPTFGGGGDGFVARLPASLTGPVIKATYYGGSGADSIAAMALHPATGDLVIAGFTSSSSLPSVAAGSQPVSGGGTDAFVARLNPSLTGAVIVSTYFGGTATDQATALAIHPVTGDIYIAGETLSATLPGLAGAPQRTAPGAPDGFVARFPASLSSPVLQSTFLGFSGSESPTSMLIHPASGDVIVGGLTTSTSFPTSGGGIMATSAGGNDVFLISYNASLTRIVQSTFYGGSAGDTVAAMTLHPTTGDLLITGTTTSSPLPGTSGGSQAVYAGSSDAFVARLTADLTLADTTPNAFAFAPQNNVPASVRTSNAVLISGLTGPATAYVGGYPGSTFCAGTSPTCANCTVTGGFVELGTITDGSYVCVRHTNPASFPDMLIATTLHVGAQSATFRTSNGSALGGCTLDVDGNNSIDALTDGLVMLRAMFGLTGTAVTNNAIGVNATRTTWAQIQPYLNGNCGTAFSP